MERLTLIFNDGTEAEAMADHWMISTRVVASDGSGDGRLVAMFEAIGHDAEGRVIAEHYARWQELQHVFTETLETPSNDPSQSDAASPKDS